MAKRRERRRIQVATQSTESSAPRDLPRLIITVTATCGLLVGLISVALQRSQRHVRIGSPITEVTATLPSLEELAARSPVALEREDLALLNLVCAEGLPDAAPVDIATSLRTLDQWANRVQSETYRAMQRFVADPHSFHDSEAYFRMLMLVTVLQQDFGVHYEGALIRNVDFTNRNTLFINGMLRGQGGTCVSMPVLYTSIAKRLGYPVYLVNAKEHMFCRWDGLGERLNIEATSHGLNVYEDDHYRQWPHSIEQTEIDRGVYLKSLSTAESFAAFLALRGHYLEDTGRKGQARHAYRAAIALAPGQPMYQTFLNRVSRPPRLQDFPSLHAQQLALHYELQQRMLPSNIASGQNTHFRIRPQSGMPPNSFLSR